MAEKVSTRLREGATGGIGAGGGGGGLNTGAGGPGGAGKLFAIWIS